MPKRALEEKESSEVVGKDGTINTHDVSLHEMKADVSGTTSLSSETSAETSLNVTSTTANTKSSSAESLSASEPQAAEHGIEIRFEIKEVPGKGRGIFVLEDYPKGTLWYNFEKSTAKGSSIVRSKEELLKIISTMDRESIVDMLQLIYCLDDEHVNDIRSDPARFTNHSKEPNSRTTSSKNSVFLRDVKAGEEITEDYRLYADPDWFDKLVQEYKIPVDFMF